MHVVGHEQLRMKVATGPFATQVASDVVRDGLGVELLSAGDVVAEVFRSDKEKSFIITTFGHDVPLVEVERLISRARQELGTFEDGPSLPECRQ